MWLLLCATVFLTASGVVGARQWLYGWHREDLRRQGHAALLHGGLTLLLVLYALTLSVPTWPLAVISALTFVLGLLIIKRDPPRELSRAHLRTSTILAR